MKRKQTENPSAGFRSSHTNYKIKGVCVCECVTAAIFDDWWLCGDYKVCCIQVMCNHWPCIHGHCHNLCFWVCYSETHTHSQSTADMQLLPETDTEPLWPVSRKKLIIPTRSRVAGGQDGWMSTERQEQLTGLYFLFLLLLGVMLLSVWMLTSSGTPELLHLITKHLCALIITYKAVNGPLWIDIYLTAPALVFSGEN